MVSSRVSSEMQQHHQQHPDAQHGQKHRKNRRRRVRDCQAKSAHALQAVSMLNGGHEKSEVAQEREEESEPTRIDEMFTGLQAGRERGELKKFIRAEAEGDERRGRS